ncbi:cadherin repeat domain-containing protein, partial [Porticoccaceae bacterium]|nr:cadherin repeat domain-containing protein [Porticoccaceae bacterium]
MASLDDINSNATQIAEESGTFGTSGGGESFDPVAGSEVQAVQEFNPEAVPYSDAAPHDIVSESSNMSGMSADMDASIDGVLQNAPVEDGKKNKEDEEDKEDQVKESAETEVNNSDLDSIESGLKDGSWGTLPEDVEQDSGEVEQSQLGEASQVGASSSSVFGWAAAIGAIGAGIAASGSGGDSTPGSLSLILVEDSGVAGDSITSTASISVSGIVDSASWEFSLDGGSSWQAGQGSSITIDQDGQYSVVARQSRGSKTSENSSSLTVTLDSIAPSIASGDTAPSIDENSGANQIIYTAAVDGSADIVGGISFSLAESSDAALSVDADTGAVTLATDPDHETQSDYSFTVVATDAAGNSSDQFITLAVNDFDDIAPVITSAVLADAIDENSGVDQVIYATTSDDSADVSEGETTYSLAAGSDAALSINAGTGDVTLATNPDQETQDSYGFTVVATDAAGNSSEQAVSLEITDRDEVAAIIVSDDEISINENGGVNQIVYTAIADDSADASDGVRFSLSDDSDSALSIDADTGAVSLSRNPNYEGQSVYIFSVLGTDQAGNESLPLAVTLTVQNLDEVSPFITSGTSAGSVSENSGGNQAIYVATADDSFDVSGGIVFSLAEGADAALSIDEDSGIVRLSADPDYEVQNAYSFTVVATDTAGNASFGKNVTLTVTNTDDSSPIITSAVSIAAIDESSGAGQVIYTATADDSADIGDGEVRFSFAEGSDAALSIDSDTGKVTLATNPDHESQDTYGFTIVATDTAGNASEGPVIALSVNDLDEEEPTVTSAAAAVAIDENSGADQVVYTATADDSADISGGVSFSLAEGSDVAMSIDADTGEVTLATGPDHESQDSYSFTVVATDAAGNASEGQAVALSINDLDEIAPTVTSDATALAIDENSGAEQVIYTTTADDTADITGGVSFSLAEGSDAVLSIDADTGEVTLATNPDHESQDTYNFTVVATDVAGNTSSSQAVALSVNDLDEVAPAVTSAATATAIDENSGAEQVIYIATADDSADVSGGISFSLAEDSDAELSIDADTGVVTLAKDPDQETQGSYSFTVIATDVAGNASEQVVILGINDLDDTAPVITSGETAAVIDENSGANQIIYTAISDDSVDVSDGATTYSLADGSDAALSIGADTGAVTLATDPDQETQDSYSFTVVATDTAGNSSEQVVKLDINDLDDTAPVITSGAIAEAIDENSGANQVIYTAVSDDSTDVVAGVTTYSLTDASDAELSINVDTGAVTLSADPDYETQTQYNFTVLATDTAGNASEQAVTLGINDVDEIPPALLSIDSSVADQTVILTYDEALSESDIPDLGDFSVKQNGSELKITAVSIVSDEVILTLDEAPPSGPLQVTYTGDLIQDIAGNVGPQFTQIIISDGYLKGVQIYVDRNNDGVADPDELLDGVTSNSEGEIILEGDLASQNLIMTSGVNMDTGAVNEFSLSSPAGYGVVNPLTTLVNSIATAGETSAAEAEAQVIASLGLELSDEGAGLSGYDPMADQTADSLANRVVTAQIASVLAVAAASGEDEDAAEAAQQSVLDNLASAILGPEEFVLDSGSMAELMTNSDGESLVDDELLGELGSAVDQLNDADSIDTIVSVQAALTDKIAPDAPRLDLSDETDSGIKGDAITSLAAPTVRVSFEVDAVDGTALVVGDTVSFWNPDAIATDVASIKITQNNLDNGYVDFQVAELTEGLNSFSSFVTDIAGNQSDITVWPLRLDTTPPVITSSDSTEPMDENSGTGQSIYAAEAEDLSGDVSFSLTADSDFALVIDTDTGVVTLNADPDHETQSEYSFTVVATDAAGNFSEQAMKLAINDLDDTAPTITSGDRAAAIDENSGAEQIIYTVISDDSADVSIGLTTYRLAEGSDTALSIDSDTGMVTLSTDPDYEAQAIYNFSVVATDAAGNASEQAVTMPINNLDDTAPIITSGAVAGAIDENSGAEQVIYTVMSDDSADVSEGVTTYRLAEGSDPALFINSDTGAVTLNTDPDHEAQDTYDFTVIATDTAGNASEQAVTLDINNLDDTAPIITSGAAAAEVAENSGTEQVVYTASSDDSADVSEGASTYRLADGSDAGLSIDTVTGAVTLVTNPDHETQETYSFKVIATDAAGNASEGQAVTLSVDDVDEVAPTITSIDTAVAIDENSGAGQVVYTATADDSADVSGGVGFSLADGSDAALSIDADTGEVTLASDPDQETQDLYAFTVVATDAAGNASERVVTLDINDLDDTAPIITSGPTPDAVDENSGSQQVIYTATSDDSGDVSEGVTTFSLADGSDAGLSINTDTGVVTLATDPDHETQGSYSLTVVAVDEAGNVSEQAVNIAINDLDEIAPILTSGSSAGIAENSGQGAIVYLAAADDSLDVTEGVVFSLTESSDNALSIDAGSGAVTLLVNPDYEVQAEYSFAVIATDAAGNESESLPVLLSIGNEDESRPVITSLDTSLAVQNSGLGQIVYTATSDDSGDVSSGVTYTLAGNSDPLLSIDSLTGQVTLAANPDRDVQAEYSMTIIAADTAGLIGIKDVTILVDSAPLITSSLSITVEENSLLDEIIYTVTASNNDNPDEEIVFSFGSVVDDRLAIDSQSGQVTFLETPDFEESAEYAFMVKAADEAGN